MTKVIGKMSEMRQQDNENVNKYMNRYGMSLADLKEKVSVEGQDFNLTLSLSRHNIHMQCTQCRCKELALEFKRTTTKKVFSQKEKIITVTHGDMMTGHESTKNKN